MGLNKGSRQAEYFDMDKTIEEIIEARECSRDTAYIHKGLYPPAHGDDCATPGLHDTENCPTGTPAKPMTGAHGWPRAFIKDGPFKGELGLSCPTCGSQNWKMGTRYPAHGTGSNGRGRLGDPGATEYIHCNGCGREDSKASA